MCSLSNWSELTHSTNVGTLYGTSKGQSYLIHVAVLCVFCPWVTCVTTMATAGAVDIVCGTSQARLLTTDLSNGSIHCIACNGELLTPCEFERCSGRSTSRNWKLLIRCNGKPLSTFCSCVMCTEDIYIILLIHLTCPPLSQLMTFL